MCSWTVGLRLGDYLFTATVIAFSVKYLGIVHKLRMLDQRGGGLEKRLIFTQ